jgi:hypothetical protein
MPLSSEDTLRLNVMMANPVDAVRIDENKMRVYSLSGDRESSVTLSPNCRSEAYLKQVREFLSGHVLGSPGGYPVYLKRWTRMGQAKNDSLADLLKLGEPEAVAAVACASGITDELARRAWWIEQDPENARHMLRSEAVVTGKMGRVLADFLVEFLPFEDDPGRIIESVHLVLQSSLIDDASREIIWKRGQSKNIYRIGFLSAAPEELPYALSAREDHAHITETLSTLSENNRIAPVVDRLLDSPGQGFLRCAHDIMTKPANQESVIALFEAVAAYLQVMHPGGEPPRSIDVVLERAQSAIASPDDEIAELLEQLPELAGDIRAMMILAQLHEQLLAPVFATSTAMGTLMRRQISHITDPLMQELQTLMTTSKALRK